MPILKFVMSDTLVSDKSGCCKRVARVLFSHIGLLVLVALYAVLGAYLFIAVEEGHEEKLRQNKKRVSLDLIDAKNYIVNLLVYNRDKNITKTKYIDMVMEKLDLFHDFVVDKASDPDINYDGDENSWDTAWTFPKSLLFTVTTMGSIGYGHIAPKTTAGRQITILYSVVGIPLLLVFLANIGDFLAKSFKYIYSRCCCRWCRVRRKLSELRKGNKLPKRAVNKETVGREKFMPSTKMNVPITVNMCVIAAYLMMGGALFSWWENWDSITAIYFSFITLTTIGFGDYVPGKSFLALHGSASATLKMLVTVFYCLFGMALVSMCISLMQEQLVQKTRWLLTEIGIMEEDIDPMQKYKYKKSQKGTVLETHKDRDGNKRLRLLSVDEGESSAFRPPVSIDIKDENER
ncbi:TWiK family of potassium channels protein 7-like isoform X1 [Portunus trituberculatus]|uniref:TWiK family of potassium channels protein 7-like isoform X1 n=2 Tax=Portunus trituberculatus TaxID=210409 RepID=UPI001E1CD63F|nr:TWiK family of potassium channels protein 7-like isoform X1 [Portunus trituberculatus]